MTYPLLKADNNKLMHNCKAVVSRCHDKGISVAAVCKCVWSDENIVSIAQDCGFDFIADSRITSLEDVSVSIPRMCIRTTAPGDEANVVKHCEISLESEESVLPLLDRAAADYGTVHKVVLMIDLGDLREGIFVSDKDAICSFAEKALACRNLELYGIGTNLSCFGSILPDTDNLTKLVNIAEMLRQKYSIPLPFVSGGATSSYNFLLDGSLPAGITNLRIGEAWLLGHDTSNHLEIPGLCSDAFTIEAKIIEVKTKPSKPVGKSGLNAFGETVEFPDSGDMLRAVCALGRADTDTENLIPCDSRIEILGASSDHLILNISGAPQYKAGDIVKFIPRYSALMHMSQSSPILFV